MIGIKNDTSTSKTKNIMVIMMKFVENEFFFIVMLLSPHSKDFFLKNISEIDKESEKNINIIKIIMIKEKDEENFICIDYEVFWLEIKCTKLYY